MNGKRISRRTFLRGSGIAVALPLLESMLPAAPAQAPVPRRMICINTPFGFDHAWFYPKEKGRFITLPPYLKVLEKLRGDVTVLSGLSHPEVRAGHASVKSFLTGAPHPDHAGFRNTISLDQLAAERLRGQTRFPSLALAQIGAPISYARNGTQIPAEHRPSRMFARMFLNGRADEVQAQVRKLRDGRSVLDAVLDRTKSVQKTLGPGDRQKLDEYFTAVREVEQQLVADQEWAKKPKPQVKGPPPVDVTGPGKMIPRMRNWCDLIHLAVLTDSTRVITLTAGEERCIVQIPGVTRDYHNLSHLVSIPDALAEIRLVETELFKVLGELLAKLKGTSEGAETLLDRTMVFFGSHMYDGGHRNINLPILLAGGGFRHGQHLAFDSNNNLPLCRLYVSMLQRLGLEVDRFASSTGTVPGLEMT